MKQHLETASAVLVLLVIGIAWVNEREEGAQPAVLVETARLAAGPAIVPVEIRSSLQQQKVPCTKERQSTPEEVDAYGGEIEEDFARVYYGPGAFSDGAMVEIIAHSTQHGITLSVAPKTSVAVLLRLGYCDEEPADRYWLQTQTNAIPAHRDTTGSLWWKKKWAAAIIEPGAFARADPSAADTMGVQPTRGGFVILSN